MKFGFKKPNTVFMSPREELENKYRNCRANLLLVTIVSILNLFSLALSQTYFLFSARMPSFLIELILVSVEEGAEIPFSDLLIPIVIGVVMTVPYLLCWIFSKKRVGWMIAALVLFSLDCVFMLIMYNLSAVVLDLLFHAWVMFYLITGVIHGFKLKSMPEDEPLPEINLGNAEGQPSSDDGFNTFNQDDFTYEAPKAENTEDRGDAYVAKEDKE